MKKILERLKYYFNYREFIIDLIKNDFKQQYIGTFVGVVWAFITPLVTVVIFWFVFEIGFRTKPITGCAFHFILRYGFFSMEFL